MLDRNTFGKTPACIYLAEHLNTLQNKKLTRKAGAVLQDTRESLNQLYASHAQGHIDVSNYKKFLTFLRHYVLIKVEVLNNELVKNLCTNILIGEIKSYGRLLHRAGLMQSLMHKRTPSGVSVPKVEIIMTADFLKAEATNLINRSKLRLSELNRVCTYY